jgi:hypothetical protein
LAAPALVDAPSEESKCLNAKANVKALHAENTIAQNATTYGAADPNIATAPFSA